MIYMKKLYLNWNNKNTLRQFIEQMEYCKSSSEKEVNIVAPDRMRTYPDICAPLSALIDEYKDRGYKFTFNFPGKNNYVEHTCISKPLQVEKMINSNSSELAFPLDKIWKYNSAEGVVSLKRLLNQSILKSWSSKMIKKSLEAYFFTLKNKIVFCKKQFQNMSVFCFVSTEIV